MQKSDKNDDKNDHFPLKTLSGVCHLGSLPVVPWTQNNIDHPPVCDMNLGWPGRSEGTVGGQRRLSSRRKPTAR